MKMTITYSGFQPIEWTTYNIVVDDAKHIPRVGEFVAMKQQKTGLSMIHTVEFQVVCVEYDFTEDAVFVIVDQE
jgi:hypothetical protein